MSPGTRIYLHTDLWALQESGRPSGGLGASRTGMAQDQFKSPYPEPVLRRWAGPCHCRALPCRWVLLDVFLSLWCPSRYAPGARYSSCLVRRGVRWGRHMPEEFQIWHRTPSPYLPPSICPPASQLPVPVLMLSQAPRGSWKQKTLLPLVVAKPARVPAGKS